MDNTIKVVIPDNWEQVSINQFQEIVGLNEADVNKEIEIISILTNLDPEEVRYLDTNALVTIKEHLVWTNKMPDEAFFKPIITIDGEEYGFINRLTDLTVGEWIDLETHLKNSFANLHNIMAILYRPLVVAMNDRDRVLEEYDASKAKDRAILFQEKAMIGDLYGALVFFSLIVNESILSMKDYFQEELIQIQMKTFEESLPKNVQNV